MAVEESPEEQTGLTSCAGEDESQRRQAALRICCIARSFAKRLEWP